MKNIKFKNFLFAFISISLLAACVGGMNPIDPAIGKWSTSQSSCINPLELQSFGKAKMTLPSLGRYEGTWSRSGGNVVVRKTVVGNALVGIKATLALSEPQNNKMQIKSVQVTGAGGVDLPNILGAYQHFYKCSL